MEQDDIGLTSYYHHHHPQPQPQHHPHHQPSQPPPTTITNGMLPTATNDPRSSQLLYPHTSAPSPVLETGVRRKRGRPRKYGTPEQAAAAKRLSSSSSTSTSVPALSPTSRKELRLSVSGSSATSFKKSAYSGNTGQGFTPYVISVAVGQDVGQKIVSFMQLRNQEMCVLSASGSISNATLSQPVSSGGNITYEVIVATFAIEGKKESAAVIKGNASTNKLPSPSMGPSAPSLSFLSGPDSSTRNVVGRNDEQQNIDGYQFMIQNRNLPVSDWRNNSESRNTAGFDFSGQLNHGAQQ